MTLAKLPEYDRINVEPKYEEFRDESGKTTGMIFCRDELYECSLCGAAVRNQELHTEWHRQAPIRSMFGV